MATLHKGDNDNNNNNNERFISFLNSSDPLGPTQPPIQRVMGFFSGIKRPEREVNHCSSSNAEVKNEWSFTTICLHGVERDSVTFTFTSEHTVHCSTELKIMMNSRD